MNPPPPLHHPWFTQGRWLALLALVALCLVAAQVAWIGPRAIAATLAHADHAWALASLLAILVGALIGGANSWWLAGKPDGVPFPAFLAYYWTGWAVGLLAPGQVGDSLTISLMLRRRNIPMRRSLAGLGVDKLVSLLLMMGTVCALPLVLIGFRPGGIVFGLLASTAVIVLALAGSAHWLAGHRPRLQSPLLGHTLELVENAARLLREQPRRVLINALLTVAKLLLTGVAYWYALQAMGQPLTLAELPAITLCAASAGLVAYLPLSLNGIGTVELTGLTLFGALGLPPEKILAAYLWLRVATLAAAFVPLLVLLLPMRRPHPPSR